MNMKSRPRISIVIPAYNEEKYIKACIESCLAQRVLPYEILVIDNKSTDRTADVVRQIIAQHEHGSLVCLLQQNEAQGLIPTRNFGFRQARGDVLGRIDADSFLQENWVENVQEIFMGKTVDAATGPVTYHDMPAKKFGKISDDFTRRRLAKFAREYAFLFGSNMAIRASTWHEIAAATCRDEPDEMHEDIDIALHLFAADKKIVYASSMVGSMSARRLEDSPRKFYDYVMRYKRTYAAHDVTARSARAPIVIYLLLYFPLRSLYKVYNSDAALIAFFKARR